jgi:serine/threonine protein kinase
VRQEEQEHEKAYSKLKDDYVIFARFMGYIYDIIAEVPLMGKVIYGSGQTVGEGGSFRVVDMPTIYQENVVGKFPTVVEISDTWSTGLDCIYNELRVLSARQIHSHPNVTQLQELVWKTMPPPQKLMYPVLILEKAPFGSLYDYLQPDLLSTTWRSKVLICRDIVRGLAFLHDCGIVHGDVKPDNILLFPSDAVYRRNCPVAKLADFSHTVFESDAKEGMVSWKGFTPQWAAPEVKKETSQTIDLIFRADIYSYGLLFWQVLMDGVSIDASTRVGDASSKDGILEEAFASLAANPKNSNQSLVFQILDWTLHELPQERIPTMKPVLEALTEELLRCDLLVASIDQVPRF